jgi:DNA-directed RNA polymerase specialized sigma24 family protein
MNHPSPTQRVQDASLIASVIDGDDGAWAAFKVRVRDPLYRVARRYYEDPLAASETRNLLIELQADGCAALKRFKGGTIESFVAIVADGLLGARLSALFGDEPRKAWDAFERRFKKEVCARLQRRFRLAPGQTLPSGRDLEDLYSDFAAHLVGKKYKPLCAYTGSGDASFAWYLLNRVLANWALDEHRREYQRWRPPEAIKKLDQLDQMIFQMMDRDNMSAGEVAARLVDEPPERIEAAIERVYRTCAPGTRGRPAKESLSQAGPDGEEGELDLPDTEPSPEAALADADRARQAANALARLDDEERLILILWLEHDDMSAVAKACGRSLAMARRIKERAVRKARKMIEKGEVGTAAEAPELVRLFSPGSG